MDRRPFEERKGIMLASILTTVFRIPGLGGLLKRLGEGLLASVLKGLLGNSSTDKVIKDIGKKVGASIAKSLPDELEDPGAAFLEGVAEGLEKAN